LTDITRSNKTLGQRSSLEVKFLKTYKCDI
jgi:hypothetical protein